MIPGDGRGRFALYRPVGAATPSIRNFAAKVVSPRSGSASIAEHSAHPSWPRRRTIATEIPELAQKLAPRSSLGARSAHVCSR
eukprot:14084364-Alexandrium_andersonii.AAC.1